MLGVFSKTAQPLSSPRLRVVESAEFDDTSDDLPCPWCGAHTTEVDATCPSCQRSFGTLDLSL